MSYKYDTSYTSGNATPNASVPSVYGRKRTIDKITIHHWGAYGQSHNGVRNYLCRSGGNTSAHEVISAGVVSVIVDHLDAAWHAGNGVGNSTTIGLELRPEATEADYATAAERIADLWDFYGYLPLVKHSDWKSTACPGKWDLNRLERDAKSFQSSGKPAPVLKPAAPAKPRPSGKGWPHENIPVTSTHTTESHEAWVELLGDVGYKDKDLGRNFQSWLDDLTDPRTGTGYYPMPPYLHDGVMGPVAVKGLQRKLFDSKLADGKRAYNGMSDGHRGPLTVKAEIAYLNDQRRFY